jgi:phenylalanyl-tRNA synthetase beta chain
MIVPIEWLKEYVDIKKSPEEIAESFTSLGLLLDKPIQNNILDLEHRMDRSDWLSILGCARDLAAFENLPLKYPELYTEKGKEGGGVRIEVECPDLVHRFNTRVFKGIKVGPSPEWLKTRLEEYGISSKNNIVDITNYVMVELGQPMHAQDISKMEKPEIVIRRAQTGEKVTTLLGETIELDSDTFVLTQNNKPTVIGGIVGGIDTAVDENTTEIVLDAGNYDQTSVRQSSRRLKIQNETVLRYDKFLHPKLTEIAIQRATKLILELAGGEYYENEDWYPQETPIKQQELHFERVKTISGMDIATERVKEILTALEYKILEENEEKLKLQVPYFRTDVEVEDDLVADVLRINDYKNIPVTLIPAAPPKEITPEIYKFEEKIRDYLVTLGIHEHITDPLVSRNEKLLEQVILENSLNSEKDALRTTLYETLLPVTEIYKKHGIEEVGVFELGRVYRNKEPRELRYTEVIRVGKEGYLETSKKVREILAGLLLNLGIANVTYKKEDEIVKIYQKDLFLGEVKLDSFTLFTETLLKTERGILRVREGFAAESYEDISLTIEETIYIGEIIDFINNFHEKISNAQVIDEFQTANIKSVTVRITFLETNKTQIKEIKEKLITELQNKFGVSLRH